jgi:hypothetical protein
MQHTGDLRSYDSSQCFVLVHHQHYEQMAESVTQSAGLGLLYRKASYFYFMLWMTAKLGSLL